MLKKRIDNFLQRIRYVTLTLFLFGVFVDILILSDSNTYFQLFLFLTAVVNVIAFDLNSLFLFRVMGILLIMVIVFLILRSDPIAEKCAIWSYIFLMLGAIRYVVELRKESLRSGVP